MFGEILESLLVIWSLVLREYKKTTWSDVWDFVKGRLPPLSWIPEYTFDKFRLDVTVSLHFVILYSQSKLIELDEFRRGWLSDAC